MLNSDDMTAYFSSSLGKVAYQDNQGAYQPVILMHGLPTSKALWVPVLPLLDQRLRLIIFDLNDYGQSEKIGHPISHQERADVLEELRCHLAIKSFYLVAHDLGASVALDYMGKYAPGIEKLVLMSPPVFPDFQEPTIVKLVRTPLLGELLVGLIKKPLIQVGIRDGLVNKEQLTPELLASFVSPFSGREGRAALLRILRWGRPYDVFRQYPQIMQSIQSPTLVIQGSQDPYIPLDQAERLANLIPNAKLELIQDGSHFLPIDTPQAVARLLNEFLVGEGRQRK